MVKESGCNLVVKFGTASQKKLNNNNLTES